MAELKGVSPDAEIVTNEQGGKQSKVSYGFHLMDTSAILALAEVLQYGASRYVRDNWRKIPSEEHFNHMMIHYYAWLSGDTSDDHLGHLFCRAMMLYATAKAETVIPATDNPNKPTQAELEDLFATVEPVKGKYEGLSNQELLDKICFSVASEGCPLQSHVNGFDVGCGNLLLEHPAEARVLMLDYLNKQDGLEEKHEN